MIAKRLGMRRHDRSNVVRLVQYITAPQGKNHRVGEVFIANCMNDDDPEMAAREMLTNQLLNSRAKSDKTYHLLVSFRFGEQPTEKALRRIEAELCARLGFTEHQRIAVVHRDTDHVHMHIAINKIHPKKLTIHTPHRDFDKLAKGCAALEKNLFLQEDNHEPTGKTKAERLAGDIEALTGNESLYTWIHREAFAQMQQAASWEELHKALALNGLSISLRGAGVIVTSDSGHRITGSNIAREFSKFHLEKKLGTFEPKPAWCVEIKAEREYRRDPKAPASPLREEYEKLRDSRDESKDLRLGAIAMEFTRKKEALLAENVLDRTRARTTRMGRFAKRKLFDAIHRKFTRQMERLKEEAAKARGEVYREVPPQSWAAWLQEQAMNGRVDALEALRKRAFTLAKKGSASLRGEVPGEPSLIPNQRIDGITKRGTVIYDLGRDAIRDDGDAFRLGNGAVPATDILALQLAKQRFGSVIFADGDRAFKARMVRAAVEGKVFIKFGDPDMERQRNELFKHQYQQKKQEQTRTDGMQGKAKNPELVEAYERHMAIQREKSNAACLEMQKAKQAARDSDNQESKSNTLSR